MADIDYEVEVKVRCKGRVVDLVLIDDEDYGFLMSRLADWAMNCFAEKDL